MWTCVFKVCKGQQRYPITAAPPPPAASSKGIPLYMNIHELQYKNVYIYSIYTAS